MGNPLQSPYFRLMPDAAEVAQCLERAGLGQVSSVELFSFSSCTPAFDVRIAAAEGERRIVLRAEQQNDLLVTKPEEHSLEKEIWMLDYIRRLGIGAPKVLLDGRILSVPGYDSAGKPAGEFRFFLMGFAEGMAMDRHIRDAAPDERKQLLTRVAGIYARIHSQTGTEYGLTGRYGSVVDGAPSLETFLQELLGKKADLADQCLKDDLGDLVRNFADQTIARLKRSIAEEGYEPTPRLVLYDGFAGNMLVEGDSISLIDMALVGYFEAVTEFCTVIFSLRDELFGDAATEADWQWFAGEYVRQGGVMPPPKVTVCLLHLMFVNLLLHNVIYCHEFEAPRKRDQVQPLAERARRLMSLQPGSLDELAAAA